MGLHVPKEGNLNEGDGKPSQLVASSTGWDSRLHRMPQLLVPSSPYVNPSQLNPSMKGKQYTIGSIGSHIEKSTRQRVLFNV
jgi:hypothetical protein